MPGKRYTPEKIINSLREAEVLLSQGNTAAQAARHLVLQSRPTIAGGKNTVE